MGATGGLRLSIKYLLLQCCASRAIHVAGPGLRGWVDGFQNSPVAGNTPLKQGDLRSGVTTAVPPDSGSPRVRKAERADLLAVYRIEQESFPQPWPFAAFDQHLGESGFLVADAGAVIGYVVADTVPSHVEPLGHIKDLAVHADYREQGVGTRLLERALAVLDARGVPSVKLEVREGNERARRLYRTHGFVHRRTIPGYYSDGEDAIVMVRS